MAAKTTCKQRVLRRPRGPHQLLEVLPSRHTVRTRRSSEASRTPVPPSDEPRHGAADTIYRSFDRIATLRDESNHSIVSSGSQLL